MATVGLKTVSDLPKQAVAGAKRAIATESLATVGGFAASRVIERTLWQLAPGTFGVNDGTQTLTAAQKTARTISTALVAVAAGAALVTHRNKHVRAAGVGLMAGATWHTLNQLGINV